MLIYLDDIRDAPAKYWTVVRTPEEFRKVVGESDGNINAISFDHDLGDFNVEVEETGYDLLKWLIDQHLDGVVDLTYTQVYVHSANPVGAENIKKLWNNFRKNLL